MMFNSLLENINRRNRSYDLIGQQPVRPQIQRISPVNITPEVQNVPMPISPGLSAVTAQSLAPPTAQVPDPVAQELPLPQSQGLTPPVAQELPLPQSQGLTPPVAQEMGPPQPMELDLPKEITSTDLAQGAVAAIKQGGIQGGDEGAAQGFGQWMQKVASDDEAMGSIILALNSLRTKPDANLATAMREQISASRKQRKETATKNRTLEVLKGLPGVTDEIMKIAEVDPLAAIKMAIEKKKDRKTLEDAAGYKRYQDTGERVFPGVEKGKDRKIIEDVAGRQRYADTGELTFPNIDVPADRKIIEDVAGYKRYADTGERVFPGAEKENGKTGAPGTRAGGVILDDFINSFGPVKGAYAYDQYVQKQKEKVQQAGVPQQVPGKIELGDIQDYRTKIQTELKPFNDPLDSIKQGRVLARDALKGNEHSEKQLDKVLAQVAGDRQTSMLEVNRLAHSEELLLSAADTISRWFSGTSTDFTTEQKVEVLDALEDFRNAQRNARIDKLHEAYSLSSTDPRIIDSVLPPKAQMIPRNARAAGVTSKMWGLFTEEEKNEWR